MKVNKAMCAEYAQCLGSPFERYTFSSMDVFVIQQRVDALHDETDSYHVLIENLKKKIEMLEEYLDIVCKEKYVKKAVE